MTSPSTSLVAGSGSEPKIGLENLPQELKDQIYGYLIGGTYCVHHFARYCHSKHPAASELSNHALFQISKRVRNDTMEVCFSKIEFCWVLSLEYCWDEKCWILSSSANRLLDQLPVDRLMNISLVFDMEGSIYCWDPKDSNVRCDLFKIFGGAEMLRKKMRIKFKQCSSYSIWVITTSYFERLTTLTGFQTVAIEISMTDDIWRYGDDTITLSECKRLQTAIKDVLEPALGPAEIGPVESSPLVEHTTWKRKKISSFLAFQPRRYLTKLQGIEMAGEAEQSHQDLDPGDFQIDADILRQTKNEATRARNGSRAAIISPWEQESEAPSTSLSEESEINSRDDADLELSSLIQSTSSDEQCY